MEKWQKTFITQNLPELILKTETNAVVKAGLLANNILTRTDLEELDAERDRKGKSSANYKLYECLLTRIGAYQVLTRILEENKQTGAARILKDGFRNFGIPKILEGFNDMEIDVQGKTLKIHEFFPAEKLELAQQIFRDSLSGQEIYDSFVIKQKKFVLAINNVPPEPPLYIPRFLSNRIEIKESLFKSDCPDVFVFKKSITRVKLSEIAEPHFTSTSNSQLRRITARFIYLDEYQDWIELKKSAKVPIHLISYDKDQKVYILEESSATLDILSKIGSTKERAYLTEDEFIQQQICHDKSQRTLSSVCICDTPGMGKTFLLENIARQITKHCSGPIVVLIRLSTFVQDFSSLPNVKTMDQDSVLSNMFKYISPFPDHPELLTKLLQTELLQTEIFFDGFDEIPLYKVEWTKQVFQLVKSQLPNVRIYITSRPHMRHELERSLGIVAYDMLPFNLQNQVDFLVRFWSPIVIELGEDSLKKYAQIFLEEIDKSLSKDDKEMAGIPLLCRLIAEVCANKVHFYSTIGTKNFDLPLKIAGIYQQFTQQRIKSITENEDEFQIVQLAHISYALKLLFPTDGFHNDKIFTSLEQVTVHGKVLKVGIIQSQSSSRLDFIHRTFAEYFVAEYFSGKLNASTQITSNKSFPNHHDAIKKVLAIMLAPRMENYENLVLYDDVFIHFVIGNFVDFSLNEVEISDEIKGQVASFCGSMSHKKLRSILWSCCRHNFYNLLSLLKEALKKWNWYQKKFCFKTKNSFNLLSFCIRESTSQMFHSCIQLFAEVLKLNMQQIAVYNKTNTLLHIAAKEANYEAVEYLLDRVSIELPSVLVKCVEQSYDDDVDMLMRRENILHLLLNKNPTLIQETPKILTSVGIELGLFKKLVEFGANLTAVNGDGNNCAMNVAVNMSSIDFQELVQFLLMECKADYLFVENEKWKDPLPCIIERATLLPETLDLLLSIPGNHINMKDENGENLLFSSAKGNKLDTLQQLVCRGLDYNARGRENRSLLHVAARGGGVEMVRYLLSLKLDPNSRDEDEWTQIHYAARYGRLSVVEVLVENGANVHAKNSKDQTALHFSAANGYNSGTEAIKYLIGKGVGVNDRDKKGNTPLHLCRLKEAKDCLIEMGADIHAKNEKGQTPAQVNPFLWK